MAALVVLFSCWLMFGLAGRAGARRFDSAAKAGRAALAVMFIFTGVTHFSPMKSDYLAMLPDMVPRSLVLIYLTGLLEIAGGIGLLVPQTRRLAGHGLILLLLAMFPANVSAALRDVPFRGEPPMSLWLRTPIQLALVVSVWWAALRCDAPPVPDDPPVS